MNSRIEFAFRTLAKTFYMCDTIYDAGELIKEATCSKMEQVQNFVYHRIREYNSAFDRQTEKYLKGEL